jgi:hypothetical protein
MATRKQKKVRFDYPRTHVYVPEGHVYDLVDEMRRVKQDPKVLRNMLDWMRNRDPQES